MSWTAMSGDLDLTEAIEAAADALCDVIDAGIQPCLAHGQIHRDHNGRRFCDASRADVSGLVQAAAPIIARQVAEKIVAEIRERPIRTAFAKLESYLSDIEHSPRAKCCMTCGHVKHNDLGYCQVGDCSCEYGWTYAGVVTIIRRDLPAWLAVEGAEMAERIAAGCTRQADRLESRGEDGYAPLATAFRRGEVEGYRNAARIARRVGSDG